VDSFLQDLRFALRLLRRNPGFTLIAIFVLAVGIGASTAIFTLVDSVLLRPLPYQDADRLVMLQDSYNIGDVPVSYPQFLFWRDQHQIFDRVVTFFNSAAALTGSGEPQRLRGLNISSDMLSALGISPVAGRAFRPEEEARSAEPVVMLSQSFWQSHFHGDPSVAGQKLTLNDRVYTIVGVLPESFHFGNKPDVVMPLRLNTQVAPAHMNFLPVLARLRADVTPDRARAAIQSVLPVYRKEDDGLTGVKLTPYQEFLSGNSRPVLLVLMGGVIALLLIACANIANLLLARAAVREKEMAVRVSLGAARLRLARQLLTESLLLSLLGGVAGIVLAALSLSTLASLLSRQLPRQAVVSLDVKVLLFAVAISLLTGIVFGLAPVQMVRGNLHDRLKQGGRQSDQGSGGHHLRQALVVSEIAFSLVLLAGAGLMVRSLLRLTNVDRGFASDHVLTMFLQPSPQRYSDPQKEIRYVQQISEAVSALPGVRSAALAHLVPLSGSNTNGSVLIQGHENDKKNQPNAFKQFIDGDYFQALRIPLIKGRYFNSSDTSTSPKVLIINQAFARAFFPGQDPIGQHIDNDWGKPGWSEIVGVVGDTKLDSLSAANQPGTYMLYAQNPDIMQFLGVNLVVRTTQDPMSAMAGIRSAVHQLDPDQPIAGINTMDELISQSLAPQRAPMWLIGLFSGIAVFLAGIGIYGVLSYSVLQRRQEIGVRMALGAQRSSVLRLVLGQGARLILIGIGVGIVFAFIAVRALAGLLFGVKPTDATTFLVVSVLLGLLALIACAVPAIRATRVDPLVALRNE
jgi:predicted permease